MLSTKAVNPPEPSNIDVGSLSGRSLMLWDVEDARGRVKTSEDIKVCVVDTLPSAGASRASLSAGVVSMDRGFVPPKQMHDVLRATMQTLRLSGPVTHLLISHQLSRLLQAGCSGAVHSRSEDDSSFAFRWRGGWTKRPWSVGCGQDPRLRRRNFGWKIMKHTQLYPTRGSGGADLLKSGQVHSRGKKEEPSTLVNQQRTVINQLECQGVNIDQGVVRGERMEENLWWDQHTCNCTDAWRSGKGGHRGVESGIAYQAEDKSAVESLDPTMRIKIGTRKKTFCIASVNRAGCGPSARNLPPCFL